MLLKLLLLIPPGVLLVSSWDLEYVSKRLVRPIALQTQGVLYCPCKLCYDRNLSLLMKLTQAATMQPQLVISESMNYTLKNHDVKRNILTLLILTNLTDSIITIHRKLQKGRHFYLHLLIMYQPIEDFREVTKVLRYLFNKNFVNSDVYYVNASTAQHEVFGFLPFPEFRVVNKTHLVGNIRKFYRRIIDKTDMYGYSLRTPLMLDPPKVLRYYNKDKQLRIHGVTYNIMKLCLGYLNGTLVETRREEQDLSTFVDMQYVLDEVRRNRVQMAAHAYALFHDDDDVQKSYPLMVVNWCLMVPVDNKVTTILYPLIPFEMPVWIGILVTFIVVNCVTYLVQKHQNARGNNFILINFCRFINTPPPISTQSANERWSAVVLSGSIYAYGYFLVAMYTSILGSFLTVTIIRSSINSMEDLINAQLPVMIINYELDFLLEQGIQLPLKFMALLRPVNSTLFYQHQLDLNSSYAYFTTYDIWHFLEIQQLHLRPPLFRYSDICFGDYHLAFPMIAESPLWRDVEYLMLRIHSSGLYYYHEKKSVEYAVRGGLLKHRIRTSSYRTVGLTHLRMVVGFLIVGFVLAFLCFLNELRSCRKQRKQIKTNRLGEPILTLNRKKV